MRPALSFPTHGRMCTCIPAVEIAGGWGSSSARTLQVHAVPDINPTSRSASRTPRRTLLSASSAQGGQSWLSTLTTTASSRCTGLCSEGTDAHAAYRAELDGEIDDVLGKHSRYICELVADIGRRQRERERPFPSFTTSHRENENGRPTSALNIFPMTPYANADAVHSLAAGVMTAKTDKDQIRQG